jgi:hypothetical protein
MPILVNGKMIKHMERVFINITMVQNILENGTKIFNMGMENNSKQMVHLIKGNLSLN